MTKEIRSTNVEGRSGVMAGFVIRISGFLRISSFVIRICEERFMESPLSFFECIGTMNLKMRALLISKQGILRFMESLHSFFECIGTMNRLVLVLVLVLEDKPPNRGRGRERRRGRYRMTNDE